MLRASLGLGLPRPELTVALLRRLPLPLLRRPRPRPGLPSTVARLVGLASGLRLGLGVLRGLSGVFRGLRGELRLLIGLVRQGLLGWLVLAGLRHGLRQGLLGWLVLAGLRQGLRHGLRHGLPHGLPPHGLPQGLPSHGLPHGLPQGLPEWAGLRQGLRHGLRQGLRHGLRHGLRVQVLGLGAGLRAASSTKWSLRGLSLVELRRRWRVCVRLPGPDPGPMSIGSLTCLRGLRSLIVHTSFIAAEGVGLGVGPGAGAGLGVGGGLATGAEPGAGGAGVLRGLPARSRCAAAAPSTAASTTASTAALAAMAADSGLGCWALLLAGLVRRGLSPCSASVVSPAVARAGAGAASARAPPLPSDVSGGLSTSGLRKGRAGDDDT